MTVATDPVLLRLFAAIVILSNTLGNFSIARGMRGLAVPADSALHMLLAIFTPWVAIGILLLILFFANYLSALSFADLTYVLPATSVGYIGMALLARFFLHEQISPFRWAGILLIALGVGFIARGPSLTVEPSPAANLPVPVARGKA